YRDVYPGIDLVYHGDQQQLEYDFVVAPGADPGAIHLAFEGVEGMRVNDAGDLVLRTGGREIRQHRPIAFQQVDGTRQPVTVRYALEEDNRIAFEVSRYDASWPLVIDPILSFATSLGGSDFDQGFGITVRRGYVYVASLTYSQDFPLTADVFRQEGPDVC